MRAFERVVKELDERTNYEASGRMKPPTLDRMRALVDVLAHPEASAPVLRITGTNGKTTTAHAATEVLRATELSVGTFTSPHVESFRERIRLDGKPFTEADIVEAWKELAPILTFVDERAGRVTWFEAVTAMAFTLFADRGVEAQVLEVGMGGAWDATSVALAQVAAFTPIGEDHLHILGPTIEDVARTKAAIMVENTIAVSAEQRPEVRAILEDHARAVGASISFEGEAFAIEKRKIAFGGQTLDLRVGDDHYREVFLPMFGEHAAHDALLGMVASRSLLGDVAFEADLVEEAFAKISVPARLEVLDRQPLVLLDGAHNPPAARALASAVRDAFRFDRLLLVLGCMEDKDLDGICDALVPGSVVVVCTRAAGSDRARDPEEIATAVRARGIEALVAEPVADAVAMAVDLARETDAVLVTGSLYVAGEARIARANGAAGSGRS